LLLLATVSVILAGLVAGGLGLQGFRGRAEALERARAETAHQALLQIVQTKAVIADTAGADDVLRGTRSSPIADREFDYALAPAVTGLVVAARQADSTPLAIAARRLARYAEQVEQARTQAAAGDAAEAARTLQAASTLLRTQVLPPLEATRKASQDRLDDDQSVGDRDGLIGLLGVLLALIVLGGIHWWLTLHTRRLVNLGLAAGLALLLAIGLVGLAALISSGQRSSAVEKGPQEVAARLVDARVAAFDARSHESLSVISNNVPSAEKAWAASYKDAHTALVLANSHAPSTAVADISDGIDGITARLDAYLKQHNALLKLAEAGDTAGVRQKVAGADGSAGAFEDFDAFSGALLARQVQATDDGWAAAGKSLRPIGWLSLLVGLAAAGLGWLGLAARSREYR
jgi:hypothetical protein